VKRKKDKLIESMGPLVDLLTTNECARFLRVSRVRVHQFIHEGRLRATKTGKIWLVSRDDLRRFAEKKRQPGNPSFSRENRGLELSQRLERIRGA
jgi:excisionase family DNA binding protein